VHDKTHQVVGTTYREDTQRLMGLKQQISDGIDPSNSFRDIHELKTSQGRVLMFEIPPAPRGMPIAWQGHFYARNHESLTGLSLAKQDEIRSQGAAEDWSAVICPRATPEDLDPPALAKARDLFISRYGSRIAESDIRAWSIPEFLEQTKLAVGGGITRAALLLLGKRQSTHHLSPYVAELSWKVEGHTGPERPPYEHFHPPFLLETSALYQRIRNLRLSLLPPGQLIPIDISKYEQAIVLEALHNCIAHQDYAACERVLVIERPGELVFRNAGGFYDGLPTDYVLGNRSPSRYRNRLLAESMVTLRMMDTMGFGIREVMFKGQARRYLPLPDFDLLEAGHVTLRLPGQFIDENYSRMLLSHPNFTLGDILALDRVQKRQAVSDEALRTLRRRGLVEGRKNSLHVSAEVAAATDGKANYIRQRTQGDAHYRQLILDFLKRFKQASRKELHDMLMPLLPEVLDAEKKENKFKNLLAALSREKRIVQCVVDKKRCWRIG
jgi:ATP-dependent DNA helicase RecG